MSKNLILDKKIFFIGLFVLLFLCLPISQISTIPSPEDLTNNTVTISTGNDDENTLNANREYDYDGNSIEIVEASSTETTVILNDTYEISINHATGNLSATCYQLELPGPQANQKILLWTVSTDITSSGMSFNLNFNDKTFEILRGPDPSVWVVHVDDYFIYWVDGEDNGFLDISSDAALFHVSKAATSIYNYSDPASNYYIEQNPPAGWHVNYVKYNPVTPIEAIYDLNNSQLRIVNGTGGDIYPLGPLPDPTIFMTEPFTIAFLQDGLHIEFGEVTFHILPTIVILTYFDVTIVYYLALGIVERILVMIGVITIMLYIVEITELIVVIIYESFEVKIYSYQIVIIYSIFELVIVFISLTMWYVTLIIHFEIWIIEITFTILVLQNIFLPIKWVFIPIFIPVIIIPTMYYIPVFVIPKLQIYLPFAAPEMFITVYDEDLKTPTHTIDYLVTDNTGNPITDATVAITYNGTNYDADHVGSGVYEVALPASNEKETIQVTATKDWYPTATLQYTLNVTWVTSTVTQEGPIPISLIIFSLIIVALGSLLIKINKKE